jgi:nicotinate-nucleotide pyrophosphorylase (carboxylating)
MASPKSNNIITFASREKAACQRLVELAWEEDLGPEQTDLTSQALIPPDLQGQAIFVARAPGVVAGLPAVELVLSTSRTPLLQFQPLMEDGAPVRPGDRLGKVTGLMQAILMAERIALNFLQHLSGIATLTRQYVDAVAGLACQILDTRKTTPGWRLLEKYAVRCGGGHNHRMGLYDGILIKDNHLAGLQIADRRLQIVEAIRRVRTSNLPVVHAEIEVDDLAQLEIALELIEPEGETSFWIFPSTILLDNMSPDQLRKAVERRNQQFVRIMGSSEEVIEFARNLQLEASGGITLANVRAVAETGVDRISVGALTHSAPALDIAVDFIKE